MKICDLFLSSFLLTVISFARSQELLSDSDSTKNESVPTARQEWIQMDRDLKSAVGKFIRRAMPVLMKEIYKKEISSSCMGSLMGFAQALRQSKLWAYKMLDSSGRFPPEGFLSGTLTSMGNYEECLEIDVNDNKVKLQGQYCTVDFLPPMPTWKPFSTAHHTMPEMLNISAPDTVITFILGIIHNLHVSTVKVGICTPSKCSLEDIDKLTDIIPEQIGIPWKLKPIRCETRAAVKFTNAQFIVLYIMGVMAFLVLVGTVVDKIWKNEETETSTVKSTLLQVAKSFSFLSNAKKLSEFTSPQPELSFFHGIFFFVLCWNIIASTFMYVNYDVVSNFIKALGLLKHIFYEMVLNRVLPLQALFYISGFVTTYKCLKSSEEGFNVVRFLVKRFFRYTPAYALMICFIIVTPTWGSGPFWTSYMEPMYQQCKENWWYNILYINNFVDPRQACLNHTWVFAIIAQLNIIAIVILLPLKHRPKLGLLVNFSLALGSLASIALTNVYYDLPPNEMSAILNERDRSFYAKHTYYRVYSHLALYCTGVFVAYFMNKNPNPKISRGTSCILWVGTSAGLLSALCTVHEWREGYVPIPLISALYATFSKVGEAAFLAWMTVAFMTGHSGGVKDVLGWRPFSFLARITFIAYIIHVPIIGMVMNFKRTHVFINEFEIFYMVLSHTAASYTSAYVLHMFFEAPWISLMDVLRRRTKGRTFTKRKPSDAESMTQKPVKYSEREAEKTKHCANSVEKESL